MFENINLTIYFLNKNFLNIKIKKISFYGNNGYITILPNHIDFIASFDSNVITHTDINHIENYIKTDCGILKKKKNIVKISTFQGIISNNVIGLKKIKISDNEIFNKINSNLLKIEKFQSNN